MNPNKPVIFKHTAQEYTSLMRTFFRKDIRCKKYAPIEKNKTFDISVLYRDVYKIWHTKV